MPTATAHPERATLLEFAAHHLDAQANAEVEGHLRRCVACRALVDSTPPPAPSADAAVAAASELEDDASISPSVAHTKKPRSRTTDQGRRLRIVVAILAVLVVALLAAAAWYVTTDNFHDARSSSSGTSTTAASASFEDTVQPI